MFRISKLLENDYAEIFEPVIVESPFTQVNTNGVGIRQYHIALTASKLLFACDDVNKIELNRFAYHAEPAEIQTLTLVHLMPLSAVQIHFYIYNGRRIMRINRELDDEEPMFLEIGGHTYRALMWSIFWQQITALRIIMPKALSIQETAFIENRRKSLDV